jgi:alkylation response protein AidB-like acyl-CoA dehydrogenase
MTPLDNQLSFLDGAREWLSTSVPDRWRQERGALSEDEIIDIRHEWDRQLFAGGYSGLSIPKMYGGQGLGLRQEVLFHEAAAQAHAPEGIGRIGKILTVPTLVAHGSEEQRAKYIPGIMAGTEVWCQAFSEPGAGSDLANVSTFARKTEGGYLVSGQKIWTSFAQYAERAILLARTSHTDPRDRNLSYFRLDMKPPGITLRTIRQISDTSHFSEVFLDSAFVAESDRVGEEGDGWNIAMTTLTSERGGVEAITRYVEIRGDLDMLMSCCAIDSGVDTQVKQLDTRLELVRWQVMKALDYVEDDVEFFNRTCMLKIMWSEIWQEVTQLAVSLSCRAHQEHWRNQYLETRAVSIYSGSNEIQRNIIGDRVLGLPR